MIADVAAKGKARLPFLFLVLDRAQENADEEVRVGEQIQNASRAKKGYSSATVCLRSVFGGSRQRKENPGDRTKRSGISCCVQLNESC